MGKDVTVEEDGFAEDGNRISYIGQDQPVPSPWLQENRERHSHPHIQ